MFKITKLYESGYGLRELIPENVFHWQTSLNPLSLSTFLKLGGNLHLTYGLNLVLVALLILNYIMRTASTADLLITLIKRKSLG